MMTRDLINREVKKEGILYKAGEPASFFLNSLQSPYLKELKVRAKWLMKFIQSYDDHDFELLTKKFYKDWISEFQGIEKSFGVEA